MSFFFAVALFCITSFGLGWLIGIRLPLQIRSPNKFRERIFARIIIDNYASSGLAIFGAAVIQKGEDAGKSVLLYHRGGKSIGINDNSMVGEFFGDKSTPEFETAVNAALIFGASSYRTSFKLPNEETMYYAGNILKLSDDVLDDIDIDNEYESAYIWTAINVTSIQNEFYESSPC